MVSFRFGWLSWGLEVLIRLPTLNGTCTSLRVLDVQFRNAPGLAALPKGPGCVCPASVDAPTTAGLETIEPDFVPSLTLNLTGLLLQPVQGAALEDSLEAAITVECSCQSGYGI